MQRADANTKVTSASPEALRRFISDALAAAGCPLGDASEVARLMVLADLRGADGHGVFRLPQYVRRIRAGGINTHPNVRVAHRSGSVSVVDGDNGMGHLVATFAAQTAISTAADTGVSWVGVRRGNHSGPGFLYAMMALKHNMVGMYCAIGNANHMAPWGGAEKLLSTNPISIAIPADRHSPVVLDMATSTVAYGAVKRRAAVGAPLPEGWMIDSHGKPLLDAHHSEDGLLLPSGGYKGAGLATMITLLAGVLNGAAVGDEVVDFNADDTTPTNTGQAIVALDISRFCAVSYFKGRVDAFLDDLKGSKKLPGVQEIRFPGERAGRLYEERSRQGVPIPTSLKEQLEDLAAQLEIELLVTSTA